MMIIYRSQPWRWSIFSRVTLATLGLIFAHAATAQVVSFNFSCIPDSDSDSFNDPGGHLAALGINATTAFTGLVSYDPSAASLDGNFNPNSGSYTFSSGNYSLSVTLAGHTFSSKPTDLSHSIGVLNLPLDDSVTYNVNSALLDGGALPGGATSSESNLTLKDSSGTALSNDSLPTSVPTVNQFPDLKYFIMTAFASDNSVVFSFRGNVTSITPVPEPAVTGVAMAASLVGFALWRRKRIVAT